MATPLNQSSSPPQSSPFSQKANSYQHPLERWFREGYLQKNLDIADEIFSPDIVVHLSTGDVKGIETLKCGAREIHGLEGLSGDVQMSGSGDEVAGVYVYRGRHVKPYFGIEPTAKIIEAKGIVTVKMSDGKVAEVWQTCTTSYLHAEGVSAETLDVHNMMGWVSAWTLTPREAMVADLAMQGWPDKQIAHELGLSTASVSKYMVRIRQKAQVGSRSELAERAGVISVG